MNYKVDIKRIKEQSEEIIKIEKSFVSFAAIPIPKIANNPIGATYQTKFIDNFEGLGVNVGICITRSKR